MGYMIDVATERDYFDSFEITDPDEMRLYLDAGRNDKAAIEHFRDLVTKRYGPTGFASFDLVLNGQLRITIRRIPYPKG